MSRTFKGMSRTFKGMSRTFKGMSRTFKGMSHTFKFWALKFLWFSIFSRFLDKRHFGIHPYYLSVREFKIFVYICPINFERKIVVKQSEL
jgi:hypothetical protein